MAKRYIQMLTLNPSYCGSDVDVKPMEYLSLEDGETKRYSEKTRTTDVGIGREGQDTREEKTSERDNQHHDDGRPFGRDDELGGERDRIDGSSEDDMAEIRGERTENSNETTDDGTGDDRSVRRDESMDGTGQPDSLSEPVFVDACSTEPSHEAVGRSNVVSEDRKNNDANSSDAVETFNAGRSFLLQNLEKTVHQLDTVICKVCKVCTAVCRCGQEIRDILSEDDEMDASTTPMNCWRTRTGHLDTDHVPNLYEIDKQNPVTRGLLNQLLEQSKTDVYAQQRLDNILYLNPDGSKCPLGCWCERWHPPSSPSKEEQEVKALQNDPPKRSFVYDEWKEDNVVLPVEQIEYLNSLPEEQREGVRTMYLYENWMDHDREQWMKKQRMEDECDSSTGASLSGMMPDSSRTRSLKHKIWYFQGKIASMPRLQIPLEEDVLLHRNKEASGIGGKLQNESFVEKYVAHPRKRVERRYRHDKMVDDCHYNCKRCNWCDYYCLCKAVEHRRINEEAVEEHEKIRAGRIEEEQLNSYGDAQRKYIDLKNKLKRVKEKLEMEEKNLLAKAPTSSQLNATSK